MPLSTRKQSQTGAQDHQVQEAFDKSSESVALTGVQAAMNEKRLAKRDRVAQAEMLLALGDKPAAHALALDLKQRFQAIPEAYPAQSFFHLRAQAVIDAGNR